MPVGRRNPNAWHNWYHCIGSTYGTWPRGDPRGFRTFHHREHVAGDYRQPPPDVYRFVFEQSKRTMKHPAVVLDTNQRIAVCRAMIGKLETLAVECLALAVASNHFHLLARFPDLSPEDTAQRKHTVLRDGRDPAPRHFLGIARKHASHTLREQGLKPNGPLWAARPHCEPIYDRPHQVNTVGYIRRHVEQGAAVWCLGEFLLP